jgi:hypothetical protein
VLSSFVCLPLVFRPATRAGKYDWSRSCVVAGIFVQPASVGAFTGWELYLWVHVKDYGPQPVCDDQVKYVIFFHTLRAAVYWLRGIWIAVLAISAVGLMMTFGCDVCLFFVMRGAEEEERAEETNLDHVYTPDNDYNTTGRDAGTGGDGDTDVSDTVVFLFAFPFSVRCMLCLSIGCSQTTAYVVDIRGDHAGAYGEQPYLRYPVTFT